LTRLVIDASVVVAWILEDERTPGALKVRQQVRDQGALVPSLWRSEIANALLAASRRGRMTYEQCVESLFDPAALPIRADELTWTRAWLETLSLAQMHRLTVYDAAYLALAIRQDLPLATYDVALRNAAHARQIVVL
jgi:predicted nucleic acid-binding protein